MLRDHSPNQAVYEPVHPHAPGVVAGPPGSDYVIFHKNSDGSVTGVATDGQTTLVVPPAQ